MIVEYTTLQLLRYWLMLKLIRTLFECIAAYEPAVLLDPAIILRGLCDALNPADRDTDCALVPLAAQAGSNTSWDATWSAEVNNSEPVSVTIAEGKVVRCMIRGAALYRIRFSTVTMRRSGIA